MLVEIHPQRLEFVGGAVAGWLLAIPMAVGVGLGSVLAGVFVALSLFVVPPEE